MSVKSVVHFMSVKLAVHFMSVKLAVHFMSEHCSFFIIKYSHFILLLLSQPFIL
jgi:hypothetical protein